MVAGLLSERSSEQHYKLEQHHPKNPEYQLLMSLKQS
jgi:hypothetical protein